MKKDGIELYNEGKYKIHDTDVWKTVYRLIRNDEKEYYIKTRENGFERVWRRGSTYALYSVKDALKNIPERIVNAAEKIKKWYNEVEETRDEYSTDGDWLHDLDSAENKAEGFCEALALADVISGNMKWELFGYIIGRNE